MLLPPQSSSAHWWSLHESDFCHHVLSVCMSNWLLACRCVYVPYMYVYAWMHEALLSPRTWELLFSLQRIDGNWIYFPELAVKPHYQPLCGRESREKAQGPPRRGGGGEKEEDRVKTLIQLKSEWWEEKEGKWTAPEIQMGDKFKEKRLQCCLALILYVPELYWRFEHSFDYNNSLVLMLVKSAGLSGNWP